LRTNRTCLSHKKKNEAGEVGKKNATQNKEAKVGGSRKTTSRKMKKEGVPSLLKGCGGKETN